MLRYGDEIGRLLLTPPGYSAHVLTLPPSKCGMRPVSGVAVTAARVVRPTATEAATWTYVDRGAHRLTAARPRLEIDDVTAEVALQ